MTYNLGLFVPTLRRFCHLRSTIWWYDINITVGAVAVSGSELAIKLLQERSERTMPGRSSNGMLHVKLGLTLQKIIELVRKW